MKVRLILFVGCVLAVNIFGLDFSYSDSSAKQWNDGSVNGSLAEIAAPELAAPEHEAVGMVPIPVFKWQTVDIAESYVIQVAGTDDFSEPDIEETLEDTAYVSGHSLDYESNYFWRVRTVDGDDNKSDWSEVRSFETKESPFEVGSGTESDPYEVATPGQLEAIGERRDRYFIQTENIDLSGIENWDPIGEDDMPFTGNYNGGGYIISNLTIDREEGDTGLFGSTYGAKLQDISLQNVDVTGGGRTGALVGNFREGSILSGSTVEGGTVTGMSRVGGMIGQSARSNPVISDSHAEVEVTAEDMAGGFIGWKRHTEITNSSASGMVNGETHVGGFLGYFVQGQLINSYANSEVTGVENVGGLVGLTSGISAEINQSYATGKVDGTTNVGGLVGRHQTSTRTEARVYESFSVAEVNGVLNVGGLFGLVESGAIVEDAFWDIESSNQEDGVGSGSSAGTTGLETDEMTGESAEDHLENFDFDEVWVVTFDYPALYWEEVITEINSFALAAPDDQAEINVDGTPDEKLTLRWYPAESAGDKKVTYTWLFDEDKNFEAPQLSYSSDNEGMDTTLTLSYQQLDDFLADYDVSEGDALEGYWTVEAVHDEASRKAESIFELSLIRGQVTSTEMISSVPNEFALEANYPNPFNPGTRISYELPEQVPVKLEVYTILGEHVATLVNKNQDAGRYTIAFEAAGLSSGTYIYRLEAGEYSESRTMMLVR